MSASVDPFFIAVAAAFVAGFVSGGLIVWLVGRPPMGARRSDPGAAELVRIDIDPEAHQPSLYLAGRPVARLESIADERVREQVRGLMVVLQAEEALPQPPPATPTPVPVQPPVAATAAPSTAALDMPGDQGEPFFARLKGSLLGPRIEAPTKPVATAAKPVATAAKPAGGGKAEAGPPPGIFEEVNSILQRKLKAQPGSPDIEIYEDNGELRIRVGETVYQRVDEVSGEPARTLLREALAEWEAS